MGILQVLELINILVHGVSVDESCRVRGVDRNMALNHMGHVLLTSHLLPLLGLTASEQGHDDGADREPGEQRAPRGAGGRSASRAWRRIDEDEDPDGQYGRSKLANILYVRSFARKVTRAGYPWMLMNATHLGIVSTRQSTEHIFEP